MFCSNCGTQLGSGVNFCPNCGTRVSNQTAPASNPGNMVMLVSVGRSNRATAAALLARICGYGEDDALLIVDSAPIVVARGLSDAQARYLAQALTEYGVEVAVRDENGWREWESENTSVWDQTGTLMAGVASVLGLLGLGNRISRDMMHRMDDPNLSTGARPPVFRLNDALRAVPSRPPLHRAPPPPPPTRPASAARPAPPPPPRPAPAARPAPPPSRPAPAARPAPPPTRPAPPPPAHAAPAARPAPPQRSGGPAPRSGDQPGRGNPGGRPGGGAGRRG